MRQRMPGRRQSQRAATLLRTYARRHTVKTLARGIAAAAAIAASVGLAALPAAAATPGSWSVSKTHYNIYSDGGFASNTFYKPQTQLPSGGTITSTSYRVTPYNNGNTADAVKLCYQKQYTTTDFLCLDIAVTGTATVATNVFNGLDPKGTLVVTHTLTGGTYPASGGTAQDTVTVNYQY